MCVRVAACVRVGAWDCARAWERHTRRGSATSGRMRGPAVCGEQTQRGETNGPRFVCPVPQKNREIARISLLKLVDSHTFFINRRDGPVRRKCPRTDTRAHEGTGTPGHSGLAAQPFPFLGSNPWGPGRPWGVPKSLLCSCDSPVCPGSSCFLLFPPWGLWQAVAPASPPLPTSSAPWVPPASRPGVSGETCPPLFPGIPPRKLGRASGGAQSLRVPQP